MCGVSYSLSMKDLYDGREVRMGRGCAVMQVALAGASGACMRQLAHVKVSLCPPPCHVTLPCLPTDYTRGAAGDGQAASLLPHLRLPGMEPGRPGGHDVGVPGPGTSVHKAQGQAARLQRAGGASQVGVQARVGRCGRPLNRKVVSDRGLICLPQTLVR